MMNLDELVRLHVCVGFIFVHMKQTVDLLPTDLFGRYEQYIYVICQLGGPYIGSVRIFTIRTNPKLANNLFFFSCDKLTYKWVCATLSLNWPGLRAIYERANKLNLDTRQNKMYERTDLFRATL